MPHDPNFHERLQALVESALARPQHKQEDGLLTGADGDLELLREARKIVAMAGEDGDFGDDELVARRGQLERALDSAVQSASGRGGEGWIPKSVGPYRIRHMIGRGGTGVVFAADQSHPDRAVALKILHPSLASAESTERLRKEADALGRLQHVGIAQIFEAGTFDIGAGKQPFISMELIEGAGLVAHANSAGLSNRERMGLLARVCDAVEHAHARGVVHRDLKPDNILVTVEGQPKLVDFGIASVARDSALSLHGLTVEGQALGTATYMAPEQTRTVRDADWVLADVFSLGAIFFELVTGTRPRQLEGLSLTQAFAEVTGSDIPSARTLDGSIHRDIDTIIGKATENDPRLRYESVAAFGADIRRHLQDRTISAQAPGPVDRAMKFTRRHRTFVASLLAVASALLAGTVVALVQARAATRAEAATVKKLYAAEMLLASGSVMEPATRTRTWEYVERWENGEVELGWEWHLLASVRRRNVVALDLPAPPFGVAWRPDGEAVAVTMGPKIGVFDAATGAPISVLDLDRPDVLLQGIAWGADGSRLVSGGIKVLVMWRPGVRRGNGETTPGEILWQQPISFIKSPLWDGRSDAVTCLDTTLKRFDVETGTVLSEVLFEGFRANGPRLSPDGTHVCSWKYDGSLTRRLDDGAIGVSTPIALPEPRGQAWHPKGDLIAHAGIDGTVRVVDAATGHETLLIDDFDEAVFSVDWNPVKNQLLASGEDGTVRVFDAKSGAVSQILLRHQSVAEEARWSPGGDRIASVGAGGEALIWSLDEQPALSSFYDPALRVNDRRIELEQVESRAAFRVVTNEAWRVYDLDANDPELFGSEVGGRKAAPSGAWTAISGTSELISIERVDPGTGDPVSFDVPVGYQPPFCHAWSPRSVSPVLLAVGGDCLWRIQPRLADPSAGQPGDHPAGPPIATKLRESLGGARTLEWSSDGSMACVVMSTGGALIVEPTTGKTIATHQLDGWPAFNGACWNPDSTEVAYACADGSIRSIGVSSGSSEAISRGHALRTWRGHANQVEAASWSPDGSRIAGGGRDRSVKVWDASSGDIVASFDCQATVADVLWLAGGAVLVAVDVAGRSYVWDARRSLNGAD